MEVSLTIACKGKQKEKQLNFILKKMQKVGKLSTLNMSKQLTCTRDKAFRCLDLTKKENV